MSQIVVNFGTVAQGSADVIASQSRIDNLLTDMEGKLNGIKERWDGAAQAAYAEAQMNWDRTAAEMNQILLTIGQLLGNTGQNFNDADNAAARGF